MGSLLGFLALLGLFSRATLCLGADKTFVIDYENDTFRMDGEPFRYVSGSIHYFRVPPQLWEDRLLKVRAAGFNAIQFVIPWNIHQRFPDGKSSFEGWLDVETFLETAQSLGLFALVRPGPYICAEHNGGGLPWWLYKLHPKIVMRSSDPNFLKHVAAWWDVLLPKLHKHLYSQGGNILMVQMENEYGSYGCDHDYSAFLRDYAVKHLGKDAILYTTDGDGVGYLSCGKIPGVYATVDFGSGNNNPAAAYHAQRLFEPHGPLINSEYYPAWLDHWGERHNTLGANISAHYLDVYLTPPGSSVNVYMAHGGTSFGFGSGANLGVYLVQPTSYDYDGLISEAGDLTEKYYAMQKVISKYIKVPTIKVNATVKKGNYGQVSMTPVSDLFTGSKILSADMQVAEHPINFEQLNQEDGFVLYEHVVTQHFRDPAVLEAVGGVRDRAQVFLNEKYVGTLSRQESVSALPISNVQINDTLHLFVENQGRVCFGSPNSDFKGLPGGVKLSGTTLKKWKMTGMPLNDTKLLWKFVDTVEAIQASGPASPKLMAGRFLSYAKSKPSSGYGSFWQGKFNVPCGRNGSGPLDTFLDPTGWTKGVLFVNGHNVGRYWPVMGPQVTLYVPRTFLMCGVNKIVMFEIERLDCAKANTCTVKFTTAPNIAAPTPLPYKNQPKATAGQGRMPRGRWDAL